MLIKSFGTIIFTLFIAVTLVSPSLAQDSSEKTLEGYKPPPLFGAPRFPERNVQQNTGSDNKPAEMKVRQNENNRPIGAPRISREVVLDKKPVPLPLRRPDQIISKPADALNKIAQPPVVVPPVDDAPSVPVKAETDKSQGVVKGPKTMPAVKADSVVVEVIDEDIDNSPTNMMDRIQKQDTGESEKLISDNPKSNYSALDIDLPHVIIFEPEAVELNPAQIDVINNAVLPALIDNNLKLNIISYASPAGDGFSSDRRFSLSRALAVRGALMDKGFDPSRINVRALGSDTNIQPFDRIELEFIKR